MSEKGKIIQLRGMSLFHSNLQEGTIFYNAETVRALKCSWRANIVRAAMGVYMFSPGYLADKNKEKAKIKAVVDAAIANGMYVLVDWHYTSDEIFEEAAKQFFKEMSTEYRGVPNVLYEIYNEPVKNSWDVVKRYHEKIIQVIRANDRDAIIICGTPWYDQKILDAYSNPIKNYNNIMYTLHFYASEGGADQLRKVVEISLKRKFPIFVTEYGLTLGTGDGPINEQQTNLWWNLLDKYGISYINWSICNKKENSAALKPGSTPKDVWQDSALTNSGRIVKRMLISKNPVPTGC
uniref:Glycoside hydrolase family 5 domain-containing protein n=1 Tax=Meloidogyne incognita TaxID=6306 RepID=A0A914M8V1_MELIC